LPGGFLAHAAGYVGEVTSSRSKRVTANSARRLRGKTGLEHQYNDLLQGTDGMAARGRKQRGQRVERLATQEAISRKQIQLTIDYDLQQMRSNPWAASWCRGRIGPAAPEKVLAMVSHPRWDP